jgi:hypothetical protein
MGLGTRPSKFDVTDDKAYVERVTCRKLTAELAETRAAIWARRWMDLNGEE